MKLAIFGSTGSIGLQLVKQALEYGHTVTAFARNPSKLYSQRVEARISRNKRDGELHSGASP